MSIPQTQMYCEIRERWAQEAVEQKPVDHQKLARAFKDLKMLQEVVGPSLQGVDALCKEYLPEKERVEGVLLSHQDRFTPAILALGWCKQNDRGDLIRESVMGSKFKKEAEVAEDPIRLAIIEAESRVIPRITVSANGVRED